MVFWDRVSAELKKREISYADFSKMTGIPLSSFASSLCRANDPGLSRAHRIAHALGVSLEFLLNEDDIIVWRPPQRIAALVETLQDVPDEKLQTIQEIALCMAIASKQTNIEAVS